VRPIRWRRRLPKARLLVPQAREGQPWFWTITVRVRMIAAMQRREEAIEDFKAAWLREPPGDKISSKKY
jgi:hypothetical protein